MNKQLRADMMLVLVTLCWGVSYYLMDVSLTDMGPFTLNAYRFLGAFVIGGLLSLRKLKGVNKQTLKYSLLIGSVLVFVYIGATFGVKYTTLSNSGFLCALTVIFVPIIEILVLRKKPQKKIIFAVTMSLIGIMMLTLKDDFSINMANLRGDLLCILGATAYAIDLILTEKAVSHEEVDAFQLGVFQLGVTGVYMLVMSFIFEQPHLPTTPMIWGSVIFLSIFCTGVAFIVQAIAQQYTTAAHVGIIFTLEPVFAAVVAYFFAGEVLTVKSYLGAVIMMAALFVTEIDFSGKKREHDEPKA
ncbi:DMT family transporter [Anaerotruncus sp. 80]|uniref:DMT family transporter n=1 Tax=Anaerotruncus colihominis TaxID=169435 RepID=A0A845QJQ4_9FIRM|nr:MULTISPECIES: DMT family transporter [Anaerotruncus]NBH62109.1 DMT family transporter [Anaerotruncus colihominis]NCF02764.1 DMT family transporter [Anaerotruncus sp. 80]